jgi:hypothetical protein
MSGDSYIVSMKSEDTEFDVYFNDKFYDNYQYKEIYDTIKLQFECDDLYLSYGEDCMIKSDVNGLISTLFNGGNLTDIPINAELVYLNLKEKKFNSEKVIEYGVDNGIVLSVKDLSDVKNIIGKELDDSDENILWSQQWGSNQ